MACPSSLHALQMHPVTLEDCLRIIDTKKAKKLGIIYKTQAT
jgi:hypothetical protein